MYTLMSNTAQVRISLYDIPNRPTIFYSSPMNWVCEKDILVGSRKQSGYSSDKVLAETLGETALEAIEILV